MWLKLDLDGIKVAMRIRNYIKPPKDDWDSTWCKTDFSFSSDEWLNYHKENDEVFLAREIEELAGSLDDLLNDRIVQPTEFSCIEPDFVFMLNPKKDLREDPRVTYIRPGCEIVDIDAEWRVTFWHDGLTANYLSVTLGRKDIEYLLLYLQLVIRAVDEGSPDVRRLQNAGIITSEA